MGSPHIGDLGPWSVAGREGRCAGCGLQTDPGDDVRSAGDGSHFGACCLGQPPRKGSVTTAVLAARTGLTPRKIDYWSTVGYLHPDGHRHPGCGIAREWPAVEVAVAEMMARLTAAGITVEAAHRVARAGGRLELAPGVTVEVADGPDAEAATRG